MKMSDWTAAPQDGSRPAVIHVVDARTLIGEVLSGVLEDSLGASVEVFASQNEWFEYQTKDINTPDLLMLSCGPEHALSSLEWIDEVVAESSAPSVAILSDSDEPSLILSVLQKGAKGYIPTSIPLPIMIESVRLILAGGTFAPVTSILSAGQMTSPAPETPKAPNGAELELTPRQREVLRLVREGKSNKVIAYELRMREGTVKVHMRNLMRKLNATNRTQVAMLAAEFV